MIRSDAEMPIFRSTINLSIIIPFHNAAGSILQTLEALAVSSIYPLELILVNDASTDCTLEIIKQFVSRALFPIRCLYQTNKRGAASARNLGAREAKGKILLFLDADVVVETDAIRQMYEHFCQHDTVAVVAQFRNYSLQKGHLAHFQAFLVSLTYIRLDPSNSPCLGSQCVMVSSETFHRSGGFNETYHVATVEDFELGYRLREQGGEIHIQRNSGIVHNHQYSIMSFCRNYYLKARDLTLLLLNKPSLRLANTGYYSSSGLLTIPLLHIGLVLLISSAIAGWRLFFGGCFILIVVSFLWRDCINQAIRYCGIWMALVFVPIYGMALTAGGLGMVVGIVQFTLKCGFRISGHVLYCRLVESFIGTR